MMDVIARAGSFAAAAARELGKVPSALTYNVRQLEDALDVLLFDRSSGQAVLTAAGRGTAALKGVACWHRDGCGGQPRATRVLRLGERNSPWWSDVRDVPPDPVRAVRGVLRAAAPTENSVEGSGTRLRLRSEVLSGTWEALFSPARRISPSAWASAVGHATGGHRVRSCWARWSSCSPWRRTMRWRQHEGPISRMHELLRHRAVAVADSARRHVADHFEHPARAGRVHGEQHGAGQGGGADPLPGLRLPGRAHRAPAHRGRHGWWCKEVERDNRQRAPCWVCVAQRRRAGLRRSARRRAWPWAGGCTSSRATPRGARCWSATQACLGPSTEGRGVPRHRLRRALRAVAERPAACRIGRWPRWLQLAGRPGARRSLVAPHRGRRLTAHRARVRPRLIMRQFAGAAGWWPTTTPLFQSAPVGAAYQAGARPARSVAGPGPTLASARGARSRLELALAAANAASRAAPN
jgi:hypothetical protein